MVLVYDATAAAWRATAALAASNIRVLYEANANRKPFTDADRVKMDGIQAGAQVNPSPADIVTMLNLQLSGATWQGGPIPTQIRAKSASYALTQDHFAGERLIQMNVPGANTVTVPADLTPAFPVSVLNYGTGQTTFLPASGVTIVSADDARTIRAQYCMATLVPLALNVYLLVGDIIAGRPSGSSQWRRGPALSGWGTSACAAPWPM